MVGITLYYSHHAYIVICCQKMMSNFSFLYSTNSYLFHYFTISLFLTSSHHHPKDPNPRLTAITDFKHLYKLHYTNSTSFIPHTHIKSCSPAWISTYTFSHTHDRTLALIHIPLYIYYYTCIHMVILNTGG